MPVILYPKVAPLCQALPVAYHRQMRVLLIVLMMALAPLRGWTGDAMAITMVSQQISTVSHARPASIQVAGAESTAEDAARESHTDCLGHGAPAEVAVAPHGDDASDDTSALQCPTCSFCQACSSPGLAVVATLVEPVRVVHGVPQSAGTLFTSAERAPGFKPPIS